MEPQTITYKTASSVPIKLDLYLPSKPASGKTPILVWFHGGGLLQGNRDAVKSHTFSAVTKHNYALVSADYRLAPQVGVAEIVTDVQDCLTFVKDQLQQHISSSAGLTLDTSRIAVSGSSAGGYLALLAGLSSDIPKVILAIYPITDPYGKFFTNPQPIPEGHIDKSVVAQYLDKNATVMSENEADSSRQKMYSYMMQEAILADLLAVKPGDDTYIIAKQLKKRGKYLPCYVVHGDADTRVGIEQADEVVDVLKEIKAEVEYERPKGLDHGFDADDKYQLEEMYAFMLKHNV